jgi:hypothetical protein
MKYVTLAILVIVAFGLHYLGASWTGLLQEAAVPSGSAGFSAPQSVASVLPPWAVALFPVAVLFLTTMLGIAARVIWDPPEGNIWAQFRKTGKALLLAPLVLYPSFGLAIHHPDAVIASLFAFQNGFFWESILLGRSFTPNASTVPAVAPGVAVSPAPGVSSGSASDTPPANPNLGKNN